MREREDGFSGVQDGYGINTLETWATWPRHGNQNIKGLRNLVSDICSVSLQSLSLSHHIFMQAYLSKPHKITIPASNPIRNPNYFSIRSKD